MTDEQRAELRRLIGLLVQYGGRPSPAIVGYSLREWANSVHEINAFLPTPIDDLPPLTTAQQLALSVLLGDESVLPQALADYLLDQGHEYAAAVAEKARREERERIKTIVMGLADGAEPGDSASGLLYSLYDQL